MLNATSGTEPPGSYTREASAAVAMTRQPGKRTTAPTLRSGRSFSVSSRAYF
jgi:hypothetical protein